MTFPDGATAGSLGVEEPMVTIARCFAKPVSLVILLLFAVGPAWVLAAEAASPTGAAPSQPRASSARSTADFTSGSGFRLVHQSPQWLADTATASTPTKSGSWWSRRTTAQKTWFIVGIVAGAYGIYALASNDSNGDNGGGGGY